VFTSVESLYVLAIQSISYDCTEELYLHAYRFIVKLPSLLAVDIYAQCMHTEHEWILTYFSIFIK